MTTDSGAFPLSNVWHYLNVVVYVREVKIDLRLLQDQCLKMMIGGKAWVSCKIDWKPLIILNPSLGMLNQKNMFSQR
jgi:hypothetical protein